MATRSTKAWLLVLAALFMAAVAAVAGAREKAPEPDLSGNWKFNDDVTARLMQGMRDQGRPAFGGPGGRGGPTGRPGGGPGGSMRRGPGGPPAIAVQDLDELSIVQQDGQVTITDSGGRLRVFKPDGKKVKVDSPGGKETVRASWKDGSLVVKIKPEKGPNRTETWTPYQGDFEEGHLGHVCLEVGDARELLARCAAAGIEVRRAAQAGA